VTDQPEVNPDQAAPAPERTRAGQPVIRDRRRVKAAPAGGGDSAPPPAGKSRSPDEPQRPAGDEAVPAAGAESAPAGEPGASTPGDAVTAPPVEDTAGAEPEPEVADVAAPGGFAAELEAVRAELDERTRDLQRLSAEYANYRKRVERDRALIGEQATANVLSALLPVLDDLDRAREHDELAEGVSAVVDQLIATTRKFGLTPFGEKGDPFDPNRHEAVAHRTSAEVSEPTCVDILRRGYLLGDRLLRPAMVAVADPE
jgi:molecular chaperone GrpE